MSQVNSNKKSEYKNDINPDEIYSWIDLSNYIDELSPTGLDYLTNQYPKTDENTNIDALSLSADDKSILEDCIAILNEYPKLKDRLT